MSKVRDCLDQEELFAVVEDKPVNTAFSGQVVAFNVEKGGSGPNEFLEAAVGYGHRWGTLAGRIGRL